MSESPQTFTPLSPEAERARERRKHTAQVTNTVTSVSVCAAVVLFFEPTWPVAFGVCGLAAMTTVICLAILKSAERP